MCETRDQLKNEALEFWFSEFLVDMGGPMGTEIKYAFDRQILGNPLVCGGPSIFALRVVRRYSCCCLFIRFLQFPMPQVDGY